MSSQSLAGQALNGSVAVVLVQKLSARIILFKMLRLAAILIASAAAFTPPRSLPHTRTAMKFSAAEAELVPRDVLFGNPEYCAGVGINCIGDRGWP